MRQLLQDDGQTGNIGRLIGRKSEQHLSVAEHLLRSGTQSCQFVSKIWRFGALDAGVGFSRPSSGQALRLCGCADIREAALRSGG